jgi:hypothetical protein
MPQTANPQQEISSFKQGPKAKSRKSDDAKLF